MAIFYHPKLARCSKYWVGIASPAECKGFNPVRSSVLIKSPGQPGNTPNWVDNNNTTKLEIDSTVYQIGNEGWNCELE